MPRGPTVFSLVPGTTPQAPGDTIQSATWNAALDDIANTFNTIQPIVYGGTGAATAVGGADNLSPAYVNVASGSTTNIGSASSPNVNITGTTGITAFDTAPAGSKRWVKFAGSLLITHDATSLIMPNGRNKTTEAGDKAVFMSLGSGNWECINYQDATGSFGQAWEYIETRPVTASTGEGFTDLSPYAMLRMTGYLAPSVNGATLRIRTSSDNGVSFDSGATDYVFQYDRGAGGTADAGGTQDSYGLLTPFSIGNTTGYLAAFTTIMYAFNKTNLVPYIVTTAGSLDASGVRGVGDVLTTRTSLVARDAYQVFPSSGTLTGLVILEGIRG